MRRLRIIRELLFDVPRTTKGLSLNPQEEGMPGWLSTLLLWLNSDWCLDAMVRAMRAQSVAICLLNAMVGEAVQIIWTLPFGEKGLMWIRLTGGTNGEEESTCPGWMFEEYVHLICERASECREDRGAVRGTLSTLSPESVWDFEWRKESNECVLNRRLDGMAATGRS